MSRLHPAGLRHPRRPAPFFNGWNFSRGFTDLGKSLFNFLGLAEMFFFFTDGTAFFAFEAIRLFSVFGFSL
jgi:hypothetical protein